MAQGDDTLALQTRIADLEAQLHTCKAELLQPGESIKQDLSKPPSQLVHIHNLLLLSDTALPLGSFAYSSGLESFLAHHKSRSLCNNATIATTVFPQFLNLSIQSITFSHLPYALATHRHPSTLKQFDNDLDASTLCTVARKASVNQGRALLSVWEKAFAPAVHEDSSEVLGFLGSFSRDLRSSSNKSDTLAINGHLAPVWGIVCLALGLALHDTGYLFLLNHAKAVLSAAVRASVMGPYHAQSVLAGPDLQSLIRACLDQAWGIQPEDAGQTVPMMDLCIGRHELVYSRIFVS